MSFLDLLLRARRSLLLTYGKVRYQLISRRLQIAGAFACLLGAAWLAFASVHLIVSKQIIASMTEEREQQRIAYLELLGEASEHHEQFSRLTSNLEANQLYLLSVLKSRKGKAAELAEIESQLDASTGELARLEIARNGLRRKLEDYGTRLSEAGMANPHLAARMEGLLATFATPGSVAVDLDLAETHLGQRLDRAQDRLAEARRENAELDSVVRQLNRELANAGSLTRVLAREKATLRGNLDQSKRHLGQADERQSLLEQQIVSLESSLDDAVGRAERLDRDRAVLNTRIAGLESNLITMGLNHQAIVQRLSERTLFSIDEFEKTIATTGIDVDSVLSAGPVSANAVDRVENDQGGPFIPGDYIVQEETVFPFQDSFTRLNLQMDRWDDLQALIGVLPLASPLEKFRVTSKFGRRLDPFTNRRSNHYGLDLGAPLKTEVLATAPGRVVFAGRRGHYGRMVEIDHGFGITTRYGHLREALVKIGQEVSHRERIGLVGSSGRSTGPHLHYEVRVNGKPYDPVKFINAGLGKMKG